MKTIKIITLSIALAFIGTESNAQMQVKHPEKKSVHALGVSAGFTIGSGISYKYSPSRFSVQVAFTPYKNEDYYRIATGLSFYYKLVDAKKVDFFIYEGTQFIAKQDKVYRSHSTGYPNYITTTSSELVKNDYYNVGLGFGFEFLIKDRVSLNLMAGYAGLEKFKKIQPIGEATLFYNF